MSAIMQLMVVAILLIFVVSERSNAGRTPIGNDRSSEFADNIPLKREEFCTEQQ
jgi:hypothetical protein